MRLTAVGTAKKMGRQQPAALAANMSASSSGRGASDEVAELKRQLAASQDNLRNERLHVVACELPALLILNPVIKQFRAKRILVITPGNDLLMLPGTNLS